MLPLFAFLLVAVSAVRGDNVCSLRPETGLCQAYFPSFFFNATSGECERFVYGGCGGNGNRFLNKQDCEVVCMRREEEVDCGAPAVVGLCKAYIPRFYYDADSRECKRFIYGGCGGNTNNFHSLTECKAKCAVELPEVKEHDCTSKSEVGLCQALFHRFYFNIESGRCEKFVYGGCGGNDNNYHTFDECRNVCGGKPEEVVEEESKRYGPDCSSPAETGMCRAHFPLYFFSKDSGKCESFVYGGCGGNDNKYGSLEECEETCGGPKEEIDCESEPETGMCRGYFPMYFFNKNTGSCGRFVYGGCGGNNNKYGSEEECQDRCRN